jgi:Ca2+-binding EF-hand superfamily protein
MVRRASFLLAAAMMTALAGHADQLPDFSLFDVDDDGLISEDEYVSQQTGSRRATESEAVAKFAKLDLDQNHTVTEDELFAAVQAWRGLDKDTSVSAIDLASSQ